MQTVITAPATPTCATCPEFQRSEHMPSVGCCLIHLVNVFATDTGCSSHYTEPESAHVEGEVDEF